MILWREGRLTGVLAERLGAVEFGADVYDPVAGVWTGCRAVAYPALVGRPGPGDRVLLNTTALELGLERDRRTLVAAIPGRVPDPGEVLGPGQVVKARATPHEAVVSAVEEPGSPHHDALRDADELFGMPVVVADRHGVVPAVVAGIRDRLPSARVAYVMTDGGALPAWSSATMATLRELGWIEACVSVGQAFGGDLEAVTLHSGLLAAHRVCGADVAVVTQGPGGVGTGTRWGFSGLAAGEAVNAVAVLGGRAVAALRVSGADLRDRHRGISHHSLTAFGRVALSCADVVVPQLPGSLARLQARVDAQAATLGAPQGHHRLVVGPTEGLLSVLQDCPVPLRASGRGLEDDPAAFLAAAAAGRHAASLVEAATPD